MQGLYFLTIYPEGRTERATNRREKGMWIHSDWCGPRLMKSAILKPRGTFILPLVHLIGSGSFKAETDPCETQMLWSLPHHTDCNMAYQWWREPLGVGREGIPINSLCQYCIACGEALHSMQTQLPGHVCILKPGLIQPLMAGFASTPCLSLHPIS